MKTERQHTWVSAEGSHVVEGDAEDEPRRCRVVQRPPWQLLRQHCHHSHTHNCSKQPDGDDLACEPAEKCKIYIKSACCTMSAKSICICGNPITIPYELTGQDFSQPDLKLRQVKCIFALLVKLCLPLCIGHRCSFDVVYRTVCKAPRDH